jgi:hypothetical protein
MQKKRMHTGTKVVNKPDWMRTVIVEPSLRPHSWSKGTLGGGGGGGR